MHSLLNVNKKYEVKWFEDERCEFELQIWSQNVNPQVPPAFAALDVLRGRGPYNAAEVLNLVLNAQPGMM